jgi:hypothetical protein
MKNGIVDDRQIRSSVGKDGPDIQSRTISPHSHSAESWLLAVRSKTTFYARGGARTDG